MEFCPTCGMLVQYELPGMNNRGRFFCPVCPYVCTIDNKIKRKQHLVKKESDPIFSSEDKKEQAQTDVTCKECGHGKATFHQAQTRSADEPMTIFYTCLKCEKKWTEN